MIYKILSRILVILAILVFLVNSLGSNSKTNVVIAILLIVAAGFWLIDKLSRPQPERKPVEINRDLFYSVNEQTLFWVAGYTDNSNNVKELTSVFLDRALALANLIKADVKNINFSYIYTSRRYKSMRVFYIKTDVIPEKAFKIDGDWNMWKWLEN